MDDLHLSIDHRTPKTLNEKIVIGIPTFQRPNGLRRLLVSLKSLEGDLEFEIVVAENDAKSQHGVKIVNDLINNNFPITITICVVKQRGISQARNALMHAAFNNRGADILAMVDDDEVVSQKWLKELLRVQKTTGSDVVSGKVIPVFPEGIPKWAEKLSVYQTMNRNEGSLELVESTASVLIHRSLFVENKLMFSLEFAQTGGGDKEFFLRAKKCGAKFAFAPRAISYETFGITRSSRLWAVKRSFRVGAADMRIHLKHTRKFTIWLSQFSKILIGLLLGTLAVPFLAVTSQKWCMYAIALVSRQSGKIAALLGFRYIAYAKIHGG